MGSEYSQRRMSLLKDAATAAEIIKKHTEAGSLIRVSSHLDADGLTAAGIVGSMLRRLDANFTVRIEEQIDEPLVRELASGEAPLIVFSDFGSGYLDLLERGLPDRDVVILDHHQPIEAPPLPRLAQVNPHLWGFDGGREISSSGVAYLVARAMDASNTDLACVAVVGALGDMQDKNRRRELTSLNREIVHDAVKAGYLQTETDLIFYGRATRPIHRAMAHTTNPFIPGLGGEEDKCFGFLTNLGIEMKRQDRWRTLADLTVEERQRILSELARFYPSDLIQSLIGSVYTLTREAQWTPLRDGREYASLLNACGRMDRAGLGVTIGMGERGGALEEARETSSDYRRRLAEYMGWLDSTPTAVQRLGRVCVIRGEGVIDEKMLGSVTSILITSGHLNAGKPIVGLAWAEGEMVKVSARATSLHLERGLNLGVVMQDSASKFGGRGGGHDVAAGAMLPRGREEEFIRLVDRLVGMAIAEPSP